MGKKKSLVVGSVNARHVSAELKRAGDLFVQSRVAVIYGKPVRAEEVQAQAFKAVLELAAYIENVGGQS